MAIQQKIELVEEILSPWAAVMGDIYSGYKNHVYRMINFCLQLRACAPEEQQKIFIAACFHDLGLWSAGTFDYLPPSVLEAQKYLGQHGLEAWREEITLMIDLHHQIRPDNNLQYPLVEVFRKADLIDVSLGVIKFGLPRATIKQVKAAFPNAGFHRFLAVGATQWFLKHPLSPPPFMKL